MTHEAAAAFSLTSRTMTFPVKMKAIYRWVFAQVS